MIAIGHCTQWGDKVFFVAVAYLENCTTIMYSDFQPVVYFVILVAIWKTWYLRKVIWYINMMVRFMPIIIIISIIEMVLTIRIFYVIMWNYIISSRSKNVNKIYFIILYNVHVLLDYRIINTNWRFVKARLVYRVWYCRWTTWEIFLRAMDQAISWLQATILIAGFAFQSCIWHFMLFAFQKS